MFDMQSMNGLTDPTSLRVKLREIQRMELRIKSEICLRIIQNQFAVCEKTKTCGLVERPKFKFNRGSIQKSTYGKR